jgi:hypothetical protein
MEVFGQGFGRNFCLGYFEVKKSFNTKLKGIVVRQMSEEMDKYINMKLNCLKKVILER